MSIVELWIWYYCFCCWVAGSYIAITRWGELSKKYEDKNLYLIALVATVVLAPIWLFISIPIHIVKLIVKGIRWIRK